MEENKLTESFKDSIGGNAVGVIAPLADATISIFSENKIISSIPFVSTIVNVYHLGKAFWDLKYYRDIVKFIDGVNSKNVTKEEINEHIKKFQNNIDKELEYILIILDKQTEEDNANILAKLYVSYIRGNIDWIEFRKYANVVDRLLPNDLEKLYMFDSKEPIELDDKNLDDSILRLQGLGLITSYLTNDKVNAETLILQTSNESNYIKTNFANKFLDCIKN